MSTCVPTPLEDTTGENRWISIHNRFVSELRGKDPEVIFLGDCILEGLQFTEMWNECFAPMHCLNFSIRDDRTENTLWRIHNGVLDNVKPKIVVVHVGTNNVDNSPQEITEGLVTVVYAIRDRLPDAYIVLPTLLPRGHQPNKLREKNNQVNQMVASKCSGMPRVQIVSIEKGLVQSDGTISHHDMYDYLNLTNAGCRKAFEPIYELLHQILTENEPEKDLTPSE
uniref:Putative attractin and platelet-activating factor acetylhydrolase n=1 Tax=Nyssomyia neivai TaxID=330878 RepID=A0A1L8DM70_9DIPT